MPDIKLLDGKKIPFTKSINGFELAKKISKTLEEASKLLKKDKEKIYASVDSIAFSSANSSKDVEDCAKKAMKLAQEQAEACLHVIFSSPSLSPLWPTTTTKTTTATETRTTRATI